MLSLSASGIPGSKLVEAHGSFSSATCTVCGKASPEQDFWVSCPAGGSVRMRVVGWSGKVVFYERCVPPVER